MATSEKAPARQPAPGSLTDTRTGASGDLVFAGMARTSGLLILLALAGVAIFLTLRGIGALDNTGDAVYGQGSIWGLVGPLVFGTLWASLIAMVIATPLAIAVALIISHYAPRAIAKPLSWLVDLLAAIPSVVYGLWGIAFLATNLVPVYRWFSDTFGGWPVLGSLFAGPVVPNGRTVLTAGIVLAIMALPIITAICREVFAQTPATHQEAALALGATKWEMIRMTVFPYSKSGMISAVLLGLGRALGETMAVALILAPAYIYSFNVVGVPSPSTIAANIALNFGNASGSKVETLIFTGLVLFVITFAVNFLGRAIVTRTGSKG